MTWLSSLARFTPSGRAEVLEAAKLDTREKAARIRRLEEEAARARKVTLEKARLIGASAHAATLSLDGQRGLLDKLVKRATAVDTDFELHGRVPENMELELQRHSVAAGLQNAGRDIAASLLEMSSDADIVSSTTANAEYGSPDERTKLRQALSRRVAESSLWLDELEGLSKAAS